MYFVGIIYAVASYKPTHRSRPPVWSGCFLCSPCYSASEHSSSSHRPRCKAGRSNGFNHAPAAQCRCFVFIEKLMDPSPDRLSLTGHLRPTTRNRSLAYRARAYRSWSHKGIRSTLRYGEPLRCLPAMCYRNGLSKSMTKPADGTATVFRLIKTPQTDISVTVKHALRLLADMFTLSWDSD